MEICHHPKQQLCDPSPNLSSFYMNCTPKDHWPSVSGKDSSVLEETLRGRACCWGWMGSASQCSMREEGGSRWPYLVPSLGGSRDGKKYLKWQETKTHTDKDDKYMDTEKTVEYNGQTKKWEVQMKKEWQTQQWQGYFPINSVNAVSLKSWLQMLEWKQRGVEGRDMQFHVPNHKSASPVTQD